MDAESKSQAVGDATAVTPYDLLFYVVDLVRTGKANTRSAIQELTGFGRSTIDQRIAQAEALDLLVADQLAASTGGRQSRLLRFNNTIGIFVQFHLSKDSADAVMTYTDGEPVTRQTILLTGGADAKTQAGQLISWLSKAQKDLNLGDVWAVGLTGPDGLLVELANQLSYALTIPVLTHSRLECLASHVASKDELVASNSLTLTVGLGSLAGASLLDGSNRVTGGAGLLGHYPHVLIASGLSNQCACLDSGCMADPGNTVSLTQLVTFLNPSSVVLAHGPNVNVTETLSSVRAEVYALCPANVTENLTISHVTDSPATVADGMTKLIEQSIFTRSYLSKWLVESGLAARIA